MATQEPGLVTIVIPVYNGANFVTEAIESALAQTYPQVEIVAVNDGSTDGGATEAILESYRGRIEIIHKANGGVSSALNLGISEARGQYICWLSHDDLYEPTMVEKMMAVMNQHQGKTIVHSNLVTIDQWNNVLGRTDYPPLDPERVLELLLASWPIHGCALMVPKDCFNEVGLFDEKLWLTSDYEMWLRMAKHGWGFRLQPEHLVKSRIHRGQDSHARGPAQAKESEKMYGSVVRAVAPILKERLGEVAPKMAHPKGLIKTPILALKEAKRYGYRPSIGYQLAFWSLIVMNHFRKIWRFMRAQMSKYPVFSRIVTKLARHS